MEFEQIQKIIAQILSVAPDEVTPDTKLVEDFGADSLDLFQIVMEIEETFGVEIDEEQTKDIHTVEDAVKLLQSIK